MRAERGMTCLLRQPRSDSQKEERVSPPLPPRPPQLSLSCSSSSLRYSDGTLMASCDQLMLHVSLETRRTCPPAPHVQAAVERLAALHAGGEG